MKFSSYGSPIQLVFAG